MSEAVQQEIENHMRLMLESRLSQLTEPQRAFFHRIFPKGPSREKMVSAIDLCDRTIRKNQAGMAERTT